MLAKSRRRDATDFEDWSPSGSTAGWFCKARCKMWNGFSLAGNFNRIALAAQRMCTPITRYWPV
jgi:hypothetical protein